MTNYQFANNLASPSDEGTPSGNVLDFPNVSCNSTTGALSAMNCVVSNASGTLTGSGSRLSTDSFRPKWYSFVVQDPTNPTPPTGVGSATPGTA